MRQSQRVGVIFCDEDPYRENAIVGVQQKGAVARRGNPVAVGSAARPRLAGMIHLPLRRNLRNPNIRVNDQFDTVSVVIS